MQPVALITGAAKRIGAAIAQHLHTENYNVVIHYRHSAKQAKALCAKLNAQRQHSAITCGVDLADNTALPQLMDTAASQWQRLDVLINNASDFYPTPLTEATQTHWEQLMASNLRAPYFLTQAAVPHLAQTQGCVINITDIHVSQPINQYSIYSMAKAGLNMQTKVLAKELGPNIRVNAIAPGSILWPSDPDLYTEATKAARIKQTPLKRTGHPHHIADAALFLIKNDFITGHILNIDGGRSI